MGPKTASRHDNFVQVLFWIFLGGPNKVTALKEVPRKMWPVLMGVCLCEGGGGEMANT